jgi:hypothetical protein
VKKNHCGFYIVDTEAFYKRRRLFGDKNRIDYSDYTLQQHLQNIVEKQRTTQTSRFLDTLKRKRTTAESTFLIL